MSTVNCGNCGEVIDLDADFYVALEEEFYCDSCVENDEEHASVVTFYNVDEDEFPESSETEEGGFRCLVGQIVNQTEDVFTEGYHRIDGWRGYATLESDDWTEIHGDVALAFSKDCEDLETFTNQFKQLLTAKDIPYGIGVCQTSNVFAVNVDFFVRKEDIDKVKPIVAELKELHRDPAKFVTTALTGKDPEDQTEADKLFALFANQLIE